MIGERVTVSASCRNLPLAASALWVFLWLSVSGLTHGESASPKRNPNPNQSTVGTDAEIVDGIDYHESSRPK